MLYEYNIYLSLIIIITFYSSVEPILLESY